MTVLLILLVPLLAFLIVASQTFGVNQEYQRAVLFRLGRLGATKGPGWYWLIPFIDRVVKVDIRTVTVQLETQETITRDGVAVKVNAVLWYRAADPARVALTLRDACSPYQVGRWGDASFLVLLDHADIATSAAALESARADMAARCLKLRENSAPLGAVTISAGVAASRGREARLVVEAAEKLLREAKTAGGNQVIAESLLVGVTAD